MMLIAVPLSGSSATTFSARASERCAARHRFFLLGQELEFQGGDDRLRYFVLQRENVVEIAVVTLGPDVSARRAIDELRRDPDAQRRGAGLL
jgi:hypothetical protein